MASVDSFCGEVAISNSVGDRRWEERRALGGVGSFFAGDNSFLGEETFLDEATLDRRRGTLIIVACSGGEGESGLVTSIFGSGCSLRSRPAINSVGGSIADVSVADSFRFFIV